MNLTFHHFLTRFCIIISLIIAFPDIAVAASVKGTIGKYPIEMTITKVDWETGNIQGNYKYASKESYLTLSGSLMGKDLVYLEETYKGEVTGSFYLEWTENAWQGKWIAKKKWLPVIIEATPELSKKLTYKPIADFQDEANKSVGGMYVNENYFLNEMWFAEDNPQLEIGYNGGFCVLEQIHADSIRFLVEVVCGILII